MGWRSKSQYIILKIVFIFIISEYGLDGVLNGGGEAEQPPLPTSVNQMFS